MKKVLVVFILLMLVVPAMATITVTATCSGTGTARVVTLSYATTGETLPPRAFGLLVSCDANGTIGTVTANKASYYVAPGSFNYNGTAVTTWGNPIVPVVTGKSFILEVGSLYASNDPCTTHRTPPALTGTLLTFPLTLNSSTNNSVISVAVDAARGGVVREDPSVTGNVTLTGCVCVKDTGPVICFPSTSNYAKQMSDFKAYQSWNPTWDGACWCGQVSTKWKYQCDGDYDATTETLSKYRIYNNDYGAVTANWKKKISDANPCADFDHGSETLSKYRVYNNDYGRITTNWKKKDSSLPGNCPRPDGSN
jgi:hypothetical protein